MSGIVVIIYFIKHKALLIKQAKVIIEKNNILKKELEKAEYKNNCLKREKKENDNRSKREIENLSEENIYFKKRIEEKKENDNHLKKEIEKLNEKITMLRTVQQEMTLTKEQAKKLLNNFEASSFFKEIARIKRGYLDNIDFVKILTIFEGKCKEDIKDELNSEINSEFKEWIDKHKYNVGFPELAKEYYLNGIITINNKSRGGIMNINACGYFAEIIIK